MCNVINTPNSFLTQTLAAKLFKLVEKDILVSLCDFKGNRHIGGKILEVNFKVLVEKREKQIKGIFVFSKPHIRYLTEVNSKMDGKLTKKTKLFKIK